MADRHDVLLDPEAGSAVRTKSKDDASRQLAALDIKLAEHLPKKDLDALVRATNGIFAAIEASSTAVARTSLVTGRATARPRDVAASHRANLLQTIALRQDLLRETLTSTEAAEALGGTSPRVAQNRVRAGTLLAIRDKGRWRFPVWQFDPAGPSGVLAGLPEILAELPSQTLVGRAVWFLTPKRQLGGRTPLELLRDGEVNLVLSEARAARAG